MARTDEAKTYPTSNEDSFIRHYSMVRTTKSHEESVLLLPLPTKRLRAGLVLEFQWSLILHVRRLRTAAPQLRNLTPNRATASRCSRTNGTTYKCVPPFPYLIYDLLGLQAAALQFKPRPHQFYRLRPEGFGPQLSHFVDKQLLL